VKAVAEAVMKPIRVLVVAMTAIALAMGNFIRLEEAPVERLLSNVGHYVDAHPTDAHGYYTLGRIHYLAFSLRRQMIGYSGKDADGVNVDVNWVRPGRHSDTPVLGGATGDAQWTGHVEAAVRLLKKALELDPGNGLYELGIGCIYEDGQTAASATWREDAIGHYLRAYKFSVDADRNVTSIPLANLPSLISYEAGVSYMRLVTQRGIKASEAKNLKSVEDRIHELQHLPRGGITPIVLSLRDGDKFSDLISRSKEVSFDLDGTGRPQKYSWVQPHAALLAWDPVHKGRVDSGRQLFGNVTWWIFWRNGYEALAALDDNHDGWIAGPELAGLALWFDRNQNGVSDPGEMIPIEETGIAALSVEPDGWDGATPTASAGVRMKDGRRLPSWDWVLAPARSDLVSRR
jgi:hypothetical protein